MGQIVAARSRRYRLPTPGYPGVPHGIDVTKVAASGITPRVNTGLVHRDGHTGQIGAGIATLPLSMFVDAAENLRARAVHP